MIDARLFLHTEFVLGPAEQRAVVQFSHGRVRGQTARTVHRELCRRQGDDLSAVVELPRERHVAGVGFNFAVDARSFLSGDADRLLLARPTNRRNYKRSQTKTQYSKHNTCIEKKVSGNERVLTYTKHVKSKLSKSNLYVLGKNRVS